MDDPKHRNRPALTPEQKARLRRLYADNYLELLAVAPDILAGHPCQATGWPWFGEDQETLSKEQSGGNDESKS